MSSKKKQAIKNSRTHAKNKAESEVFVLPPNLLQKLGIDLGVIQDTNKSMSESPTESENSKLGQVSLTNTTTETRVKEKLPFKSKISDDLRPQLPTSSILETAILMKKSVFLSPTFVSPVSSISGEIEISNVAFECCTNTYSDCLSKKENNLDENSYFRQSSENIDDEIIIKDNNIVLPHKKNDVDGKTEVNLTHSIKYKRNTESINSFLETNKVKKSDIAKKSKVTIINEEIITPSNAIKIFPSLSTDLIPLSLNTPICKTLIYNKVDKNQQASTYIYGTSKILEADSSKILQVNTFSHDSMKEIDRNSKDNVESAETKSVSNVVMDSDINESVVNLDTSSNEVKEIAEYLAEYTQFRNKEKQTKMQANKVNKLVRQGVEKPGGLGENYLTKIKIKTYPSSKKHQLSRNFVHNLSDQLLKPDKMNILDTATCLVDQTFNENFCLCQDFGQMTYYDEVEPYNHIHFWEINHTKCAPEVVYSIFDDINSLCKQETTYLEEELESQYTSICWNNNFANTEEVAQQIQDNTTSILNQDNSTDGKIDKNPSKGLKSTESRANIQYTSHSNPLVKKYYSNCSKSSQDLGITKENIIENSSKSSRTSTNLKNTFEVDSPAKNIHTKEKEIDKTTNEIRFLVNKPKASEKEKTVNCVEMFGGMEKKSTKKKSVCSKTTESNKMEVVVEINMDFKKVEHRETNKDKSNVSVEDSTASKKNIKRRLSKTTSEELADNTCEESENKRSRKIQKNEQVICKTSKNTSVECGVCNQKIKECEWTKHIETHCFIAWKVGENLNLEDDELKEKLNKRVKSGIVLECPFCNIERKYAKKFLSHIHQCLDKGETVESQNYIEIEVKQKSKNVSDDVICAVCKDHVNASVWMHHISKEHHYLAWKDGDEPLVMDDNESVRQHLYNIVKEQKVLSCSKCGVGRKYVKSYIQHVQRCVGVDVLPNPADISLKYPTILSTGLNTIVKCGVCHKEVEKSLWIPHIQREHDYLAWKEGQEELDLNDDVKVHEHLMYIGKTYGLVCKKCGLSRKYVKLYLDHKKSCSYVGVESPDEICVDGEVECALCHKKILQVDWKSHAMKEHYNVAWCVGMKAIDVKNSYEVERYLKEYKKLKKSMVCNVCGISRVSFSGFYAHVIVCGKSDEETEMFKDTCTLCNSKYLGIYKNQHLAFHREQEYAKIRKEKVVEDKVDKKEPFNTSGRRQAATKAESVIQEYNSSDFPFICSTCGFGTDLKKELARHRCKLKKEDPDNIYNTVEDTEVIEDEDSHESGVDSNLSEEENEEPVRKRTQVAAPSFRIPKIPFKVPKIKSYLREAGLQFSNYYFTDDVLFSNWCTCEYKLVPLEDQSTYMPALEESCQITISDKNWFTLQRFCVKNDTSILSIFTGGSIQCVSWSPNGGDSLDNYLAVSCHQGSDTPRFSMDETPQHPGCLQLWNFNDMKSDPTLDLCIAHDYGTVWGLDWCPSGTRGLIPEGGPDEQLRLGLLAISCSNGSAYILPIPYPSSFVEKPNMFYKIKPVAELRLSSSSERKRYQATRIRWSSQKSHSTLVVGYSDGTLARYDLNNESPLLKATESGVTIFYPYDDDRTHNMCITGMDSYPSLSLDIPDAVCSSSATGAELASWCGATRARTRLPTASSASTFVPHWPSAMLAGDDVCIWQAVSEVEVGGGGRRLGAAAARAGCVRCGAVAECAPPALRQLQLHPALPDRTRREIGLLEMKSLKPARKVKIDELAKKIEPFTYEEAVKKYGIRIQLFGKKCTSISKQEMQPPDRFPLADVNSMAYCSSPLHHTKVAIATHSGVLFLIDFEQ